MSKQIQLSYVMYAPCEDTEEKCLAEIPALSGCRAWGDTPEEALWILEDLAAKFIESYEERGKPLPPGIASVGQLVLAV